MKASTSVLLVMTAVMCISSMANRVWSDTCYKNKTNNCTKYLPSCLANQCVMGPEGNIYCSTISGETLNQVTYNSVTSQEDDGLTGHAVAETIACVKRSSCLAGNGNCELLVGVWYCATDPNGSTTFNGYHVEDFSSGDECNRRT